MIRAIVAVDKEWGIGKKNGLLFNIPEDMKFFREKTTGTVVCMGYNTLLSFPGGKPLKNRINATLCPPEVKRDDLFCFHDLNGILEFIKNAEKDVYIIGGAMFYHTMLPYCEEVYVTKVDEVGNAEVFFDDLDKDENFSLIYESPSVAVSGYNIRFTTYRNDHPKKI